MSEAVKRIRIVKRKQREIAAQETVTAVKSDKEVRREIAHTITVWIEERKDLVSSNGLKLMFELSTEPSS